MPFQWGTATKIKEQTQPKALITSIKIIANKTEIKSKPNRKAWQPYFDLIKKYRDIWTYIRSLPAYSWEKRFLSCDCGHYIIEHHSSGKCALPTCDCTKFASSFSIEFPRRRIIDAKFWKSVEQFIEESFNAKDEEDETDNKESRLYK